MLCINAACWQARASGIAGNEESRDEQRRSSARLLNLHIAIYSTMHGHPPPIYDSIVPPLFEKIRRPSWHSTKAYYRKKYAVLRYPGKFSRRILSGSYRLFAKANRGERATIILRQSPRKSSQRENWYRTSIMRQFLLWAKNVGIGNQ